MDEVRAELARVVRDHAGRLAACLIRALGDFATAEDVMQDAIETALKRWPVEGIPEHPDAWLLTVARRRGIDLLRRQSVYRDKLAQLDWPVPSEPDDRLKLIFTCCHPALPRQAQVALTLRTVCGLTTGQIAAAFLVPETAISQRITRAKRKITEAGIPYRIPSEDELPERLAQVLATIYLLFNEGYLTSTADRPHARDLADEAEHLAATLAWLVPHEPEVLGLLALIRLHQARSPARFTPDGALVLLKDQDRALWDHGALKDATRLLERAAAGHRPGPYQVQAAIIACHAESPTWQDTDWTQILLLYDLLVRLTPTPVVRLHRAIAARYVLGARAALAELDALAPALDTDHLFHATRAELLRDLDRHLEAHTADRRALAFTTNPAQHHLLTTRLTWR
ncbi:RNA polymerase sigma factor [Spirillospora sp. CA-294931]|uniref:RNA polymerase sigma factor n=1 Tax=Spirillospora sp. CA-294931 TaxID=3240042 RepID=UPI003D8D3BD7